MSERRQGPVPAPTVVVFGATVAGMTAAQELAGRGFEVNVLSPANESPAFPLGSGWMPRKRIEPFEPRGRSLPPSAPVPEETCAEPFPSVFRHLRDTLAAIPSTVEGKSLADGLLEQAWRPLRGLDVPHPIYTAAASRNLDQLLDVAKIFATAGYSPQDGQTFVARLLRYLISSPDRRRAECQTVSMLDYLCGSNAAAVARSCEYSSAFIAELAGLPDLILGIGPGVTDARTALDWYVQWLTGDPGSTGPRHFRFAGSRREAWFEPWKAHLKGSLGVRFLDATLKGLVPSFASERAAARGSPMAVAARVGGCSTSTRGMVERADYLIVATGEVAAEAACASLPPIGIPGQLRGFSVRSGAEGTPARGRGEASDGEGRRWEPAGGVQLFVPARLELGGPLFVPGSPWKLTVRPQLALHPRPPRPAKDKFGCVLSVDIGAWGEPAPRTGKTAWASDARALAQEVWRQIEDAGSLRDPRGRAPGTPRWFALDSRVGSGRGGARQIAHRLVCLPGDWGARPGPEPGTASPAIEESGRRAVVWRAARGGTWVHWGRLLFAGEYLKTNTRIGGAEGACESGREAANAVIAHARAFKAYPRRSGRGAAEQVGAPRAGERAKEERGDAVQDLARTWNPEELEVEDLASLRHLDDWCARERLPHPFELAGLDSWISLVSWFGVLYPVSEPLLKVVLNKLRTIVRPAEGNPRPTAYQEAALDILKRLREALERHAKT